MQYLLRGNKAQYDEDRLREWRERKMMGGEDTQLKNLYLEEETRKAKERMEEETQELQEKKMDEMFRKMLLDGEIEKE